MCSRIAGGCRCGHSGWVLSFVALTLAASQQTAGPLRFVGIIAAIALVYYFALLRPRRKAHFIMDLAYEEPEA